MTDTLIEKLAMPGNWADRAACRVANPKLFDATSSLRAQVALGFCKTCPVKDACLQDALDQDVNPEGVWGGTTHKERRKLHRYGSTQARQAVAA